MASPQRENGFTPIANEIFEAVQMYKFSLNEIKVIMCVWRFTYGFNRKSHEMSLSFFMNHTGLNRSRVNDSLKRLLECDVLEKTKQGNAKQTNCYLFNKNYEAWKVEKYSSFQDTSINNITSVQIDTSEHNDTSTSVQFDTRTSVQFDTQERNIKENIKENIPYKKIIDYLNQKAGAKFKHTAAGNKKFIQARWNEKYSLDDFMAVIDYCCAEWKGKTFSNGFKGDDYLRPSTLFNGKFDERLNKATANHQGATKTELTDKDREMIERVRRIDEITDLMETADDDEFEKLEKERTRLQSELSRVG